MKINLSEINSAKQLIGYLCLPDDISQAELSRRLGTRPQGLNRQIQSDKFSIDEWKAIANAVDMEVVIELIKKQGTELESD